MDKPAYGEYLECRSRVVKPGKQLLITESEVYAIKNNGAVAPEEEILVAKALLTMLSVPGKKLPQP